MSNFDPMSASDQAGSIIGNGPANPNDIGGGNTGQPSQSTVSAEEHRNLEQKYGEQSNELGEMRGFIDSITPLLGVLDKSPQMVQAILDGKIDENLASAAIQNRVSVQDAEIIAKANEQVKKDMGNKDYNAASAADITKLIEEKVFEAKQDFESRLKETESDRDFKESVDDFIARTPDFMEYAKEIDKWIDDHNITDIDVAYWAVKGKYSDQNAVKRAEIEKAEYAKSLAMGGGNGRMNHIPEGVDAADALIAGRANPNIF